MFCLFNKLDLCDDIFYVLCDINYKDGILDDFNLVISDVSCLIGKYIKFYLYIVILLILVCLIFIF